MYPFQTLHPLSALSKSRRKAKRGKKKEKRLSGMCWVYYFANEYGHGVKAKSQNSAPGCQWLDKGHRILVIYRL